jgi:hypothetical protein
MRQINYADGLLPTREGLKAAKTLLIQLQAMLGDGLRLDDIAVNYAAKDIKVNFTPEEYLAFAMESVNKAIGATDKTGEF